MIQPSGAIVASSSPKQTERYRQQLLPPRIWIATDPDHTARAVILARIALGSQRIRVGPADWPTPSSGERRKLLRDALRPRLLPVSGRIVGFRARDLVKAAQVSFRLRRLRPLLVREFSAADGQALVPAGCACSCEGKHY